MPRTAATPKAPPRDHLFRLTHLNERGEWITDVIIARSVSVLGGGALVIWTLRDGVKYQRYLAPGHWYDCTELPPDAHE